MPAQASQPAAAERHGIDIVAARRAAIVTSPVALRGAFRLLFLGGALWALVVVVLWVAAFSGALVLPTAMEPLAWHQHEMLFGYLGAVIAGFLSAAIPNWTGRPPYSGWAVAGFAGLWLAARLAVLLSTIVPAGLAAVLDVGFLLLLALAAGREVIAAKNRNVPVVIVVLLLASASALHHAETMGAPLPHALGVRMGFALVLVLIALIGGRIIPAFTRNWLTRAGMAARAPGPATRFDLAAIALLAVALAGWVIAPTGRIAGGLLIAAGLAHAVRLSRWAGLSATRDPLVFILHVSYAWLPLGLVLLGAADFTSAVPVTAAMHALAAGAMASMTLAVMTRATLGHTGRPLAADRKTVAIYVLVTLGAALRVASPFLPFDYVGMLHVAGCLWGGAFMMFVIAYGPKLLGPRIDGLP